MGLEKDAIFQSAALTQTQLPPLLQSNSTKKTKSSTQSSGKRSAANSFGDVPERTLSDVSSDSQDGKDDDNQFLLALENMNRGIVEKWEDMLRMFNCGKEEKNKRDSLVLSSESHFDLRALDGDDSIGVGSRKQEPSPAQTNDPIQKSKRDTEDFVRVVSPMIADLGVLIDALGMNDPSRV